MSIAAVLTAARVGFIPHGGQGGRGELCLNRQRNLGHIANPLVHITRHTPGELASLGWVRLHAVGWRICACLGGHIAGTLRVVSVQSIAFNT